MQAAFRLSFLACAGVVVLLAAACPAFADWTDHRSEDGNYSARFPSAPKTSVQGVDTAIGKIDMHMAISEQGGVGYTVIHAKFPAVVENAPAEQILEGAKSGITGRGITVTVSKKINLGDFPGLELQGSDPNGLHLRARLYMVKSTMYQIMIASKNEKQLNDDDADKFYRSFKLLNTPAKK